MLRLTRAGLAVAVTAFLAAGLGFGSAARAARADQVLYSFGGANGAGPLDGVVVGPGGVLYGTTVFGGRFGDGCVFSLTPAGAGYTEKVLFSFHGGAGSRPGGNVTVGPHGDLYGDTVIGGAGHAGVVFELVPSGPGYRERVLYSFTGGPGGSQPIGTLVRNARGDLFGVTQFGGRGNQGVIFELTPSGSGYTEKVLHSFASGGGQPQAGLATGRGGTLYGTLYGLGATHVNGTVFRLRLTASGPVYTGLYYFPARADGQNPIAPLTVDTATGVIYGSTQYGGRGDSYGTVFSLTPSGAGYTEKVLHSFTGSSGGLEPQAPLLLTAGGDLYGTTSLAGKGCHGTGCGTVFELTGDGVFKLVYQFTGAPDGAGPESSGLAAGPDGILFGTTSAGGTVTSCTDGGPGGALGCGTVFGITR